MVQRIHSKETREKIRQSNNIFNLDSILNCEELWDINNGITLCVECHCRVDEKRNRFVGNYNGS